MRCERTPAIKDDGALASKLKAPKLVLVPERNGRG